MNRYLEKVAQQLVEPAHPENLGIDLSKGSNEELNKWLIAVTLFSKPIQRSVAARASKQFSSEGITTADAIQSLGYDGLVKALGRGHYVRYDFAMSDTLLAQAEHLKSKYGTLRNLIDSRTPEEIRQEIQSFKGIGPLGSKLFVEGIESHLDKYRGPPEDVPLVHPTEDQVRLREILVNSSRRNLFNPYATDKYDWSQSQEERNAEDKLIKYRLKDKDTGEFVELHHPDVQKYRLRDGL